MLSRNSRYYGREPKQYPAPDGRTVAYLPRRLVPQPGPGEALALHTISAGDRLDTIAARYYDDPELFWQLCDANRAMHPRELVATIGRPIVIPLPE